MKIIKFILAMMILLIICLILSITDFTLPEENINTPEKIMYEITPIDATGKTFLGKEIVKRSMKKATKKEK